MSLSKAERQLPQYCYCHPRSEWRSFHPSEGTFINNNSLFICHDCLKKRRKHHRQKSSTSATSLGKNDPSNKLPIVPSVSASKVFIKEFGRDHRWLPPPAFIQLAAKALIRIVEETEMPIEQACRQLIAAVPVGGKIWVSGTEDDFERLVEAAIKQYRRRITDAEDDHRKTVARLAALSKG